MKVTVEDPRALDAASAIRLVNDIRAATDVEIHPRITTAIEDYRGLSKSKIEPEEAYQRSLDALLNADDFEKARNLVVRSANLLVSDSVQSAISGAAVRRLLMAVFDESRPWQSAVVERFNEVVESFELNEVARDLPNFGDPGSFNMWDLGGASGRAVDLWRTAAEQLGVYWDLYKRIVAVHGDQLIGPKDVDDLATNLVTACILGDPGSFRRAESAAAVMVSAYGHTDSARGYGTTMPFIIPHLAGYDLRLHTTHEAALIRARLR